MEGVEHHRLLPRHGGAGEEDRPAAGQPAQGLFQLGLARRLGGLVLEIAGDGDAAGLDPQGQQAVAVLRRSGRRSGRRRRRGGRASRRRRRIRPKLRSPTRPLTTAMGRPRRRASRSTQRPVVPLDQHQGARLVAAEEAADGEAEVEGEVGHLGAAGEGGAGALLAGGGDGGDQQRGLRRQRPGQGGGDADLPHRDGVEPERPLDARPADPAARPSRPGRVGR